MMDNNYEVENCQMSSLRLYFSMFRNHYYAHGSTSHKICTFIIWFQGKLSFIIKFSCHKTVSLKWQEDNFFKNITFSRLKKLVAFLMLCPCLKLSRTKKYSNFIFMIKIFPCWTFSTHHCCLIVGNH